MVHLKIAPLGVGDTVDGSEILRLPVEVGSLPMIYVGSYTSQVVVSDF